MNTLRTDPSTPVLEPDGTATAEPVPFVDLGWQHRRIAGDVARAIAEVMETTSFVLGPQVTAFERAYAAFCEVEHCVGVGNGTDAIEIALRASGIGPGDEVIVPANTFVATAEAVLRAGATLVLADCDEDLLLDPGAVAERRTDRTRAVIAVDLYGQVARMEEIRRAVGDDVLLFEDAAQSQGASRHGQAAGSFGQAAATSFYPGKNLGAYGDAGALTTNDAGVAERARALRNHGGQKRYEHTFLGTNSRLDSMQAAVLSLKLRELPAWNNHRREAAQRYARLFAGVGDVRAPRELDGNHHVWHLYVVRVPRRDAVLQSLQHSGIAAGIHYPAPIHLLPAFAFLDQGRGDFPVAERTAGEIMSLPMFPGITEEQQERVVTALLGALG